MITYIYFVKCPNCEDEHFDFFDEAKGYAMGCLSQKPIITQTEVTRNDFGECTDHCDLGTVWSWEDVVGKETATEPAVSVFTKDDLECIADGKDPEFDAIDNSVDFEIDETSETPVVERKPIPEGMTIEQLVETMEENEDMIECAGCEELFPKDECFHKEGIGYLCSDCEDRIVRCTWCDDLYDKGECRYEVDLGWLCDRCESAIKSRGETLTFREGNYWDFLDEDFQGADYLKIIDKPEDGGKWYTISDLAHNNELIKFVCANSDYKIDAVVSEILVDRWGDPEDIYYVESSEEDLEYIKELLDGDLTESTEGKTWTCYLNGKDVGTVQATTEEEAYHEMEKTWSINNEDAQVVLEDELNEEVHDLGNEYDGGYPTEKSELPETDEISDSHISLCPECGKESFDTETGICVACGFN